MNCLLWFDADALCDDAAYAKARARVSPARRDKADAFRIAKDRRLSLGAGLLLCEAFDRLGIEEPQLAFDENGKPYLPGREDVRFNLSHSGHYAALALSDEPVGVDVEQVRSFSEALVKRVFLPAETACAPAASGIACHSEPATDVCFFDSAKSGAGIRSLCAGRADCHDRFANWSRNDSDRDRFFTRLWTVKESMMKYFGTGLSLDPRKIAISFSPALRAACEGFPCEALRFTTWELPDACLTVCSTRAPFTDRPEEYRLAV